MKLATADCAQLANFIKHIWGNLLLLFEYHFSHQLAEYRREESDRGLICKMTVEFSNLENHKNFLSNHNRLRKLPEKLI